MSDHASCVRCKKAVPLGSHLCTTCQAEASAHAEYVPIRGQASILITSVLARRLYALQEEFYSDPQNEAAFQHHYAQLSDVPSQSQAG